MCGPGPVRTEALIRTEQLLLLRRAPREGRRDLAPNSHCDIKEGNLNHKGFGWKRPSVEGQKRKKKKKIFFFSSC